MPNHDAKEAAERLAKAEAQKKIDDYVDTCFDLLFPSEAAQMAKAEYHRCINLVIPAEQEAKK